MDLISGFEKPHCLERSLRKQLGLWQMRKPQLSDYTIYLARVRHVSFEDSLHHKLLMADLIHFEGVAIRASFGVVQYEARSYTWGQPEFTYSRQCSGMTCSEHSSCLLYRESRRVC